MFVCVKDTGKKHLEKTYFSEGSNIAMQPLSQEVLKDVCQELWVCTKVVLEYLKGCVPVPGHLL